jgi:putative transposase
MPNYIRPQIPGARVFFTVALAQRGTDTLVREVGSLRAAVRATMTERPFGIDAWVVLPDHMHAVWTLPEGDSDFSVRWGAIKSRFTREVKRRVGFHPTNDAIATVGWNPTLRSPSKIAKGDAGIWQRRFWEHHIRTERDMAAAIRYCWINPVKHGLVDDPADWPYSSYHRDGGYNPFIAP